MTSKRYGELEIVTPSDREIRFTRNFKAPRKLLWDVHTKPELVKRWLTGPDGWDMPICEIDFRVGGKWRYGWAQKGRESFEMHGVFREIVPHEKFVHTENYQGTEAVSTTEFRDEGKGSHMTLTLLFPSKDARDGALKTGMETGMERGYERIEEMAAKA